MTEEKVRLCQTNEGLAELGNVSLFSVLSLWYK